MKHLILALLAVAVLCLGASASAQAHYTLTVNEAESLAWTYNYDSHGTQPYWVYWEHSGHFGDHSTYVIVNWRHNGACHWTYYTWAHRIYQGAQDYYPISC